MHARARVPSANFYSCLMAVKHFTLDHNCLVALERREPEALAIRSLVAAHESGQANVAVVAISASENQQGGRRIANFGEFLARLDALGLASLKIILPMAYWDIAFWDHALLTDDAMIMVETDLHTILFPRSAFSFEDFCAANSNDPNAPKKWRNRKCDVQGIWSHIYARRDVFVTSDKEFHKPQKKPALISRGAGAIEYPSTAVGLIS